MKKFLTILVILILVTTTALAESKTRTAIFGSLEMTTEDNQATVQSDTNNQTTIILDITNMKPGDTKVFSWSLKNIGDKPGIIDYLRLKATQNGGETNFPESIDDPDNSGDLGSLLICTLNYNNQNYILPMDEVLSSEGIIYNPQLLLNPNESSDFLLSFFWPNHNNDNIGQGDEMTTYVDMHMTEVESDN